MLTISIYKELHAHVCKTICFMSDFSVRTQRLSQRSRVHNI